MLASARAYFKAARVLEVDLPFLSDAPVTDPNIASVEVRSTLAAGRALFLHTSPEYAMKRLLAAGFPDIYFLGRVFRDGEAGPRHQPEFTMVEWYRLGFDLEDIIADTEAFLAAILDEDFTRESATRVSYRDAFIDSLGIDPLVADTSDLAAAAGADDALRNSLGDDRDAWLDLLLATRVAAGFARDRLTVLYGYPASQAALARLADGDAAVADRFEVFCGDTELANGYAELTDATEQARRFETERDRRRAQGQVPPPADERLLAALRAGLPDCAGVAVGFDRLVMLNTGSDDIRDVYHFPWGDEL